ncbi:MAG: hypothetical protein IJY22_01535, partial [Clostridia bacterium]|nr:hypothetical protein [Clostridia bacterium]
MKKDENACCTFPSTQAVTPCCQPPTCAARILSFTNYYNMLSQKFQGVLQKLDFLFVTHTGVCPSGK